jgi:hypothetical protein
MQTCNIMMARKQPTDDDQFPDSSHIVTDD